MVSRKLKGYQLSWHIKNPLIHINMLYAYIANVCVAKFARRQGIASNIIHLAANMAALEGFKQLFVHVNADNIPGQELYQKHSFKIVEAGSSSLSKEQRILMSLDL